MSIVFKEHFVGISISQNSIILSYFDSDSLELVSFEKYLFDDQIIVDQIIFNQSLFIDKIKKFIEINKLNYPKIILSINNHSLIEKITNSKFVSDYCKKEFYSEDIELQFYPNKLCYQINIKHFNLFQYYQILLSINHQTFYITSEFIAYHHIFKIFAKNKNIPEILQTNKLKNFFISSLKKQLEKTKINCSININFSDFARSLGLHYIGKNYL